MRVRNPESKKRQLLDAALSEFAARGIAGSRIEAIAERAQCSAGLVYTYFGNKEGLFDAVVDDITADTVDQIPITPQDLPGYAARLYDAITANPEIDRFVTWYQLEHEDSRESSPITHAVREKIAALTEAQQAGTLSTLVDAPTLVLAVQAIARMWASQPSETLDAVDPSRNVDVRRAAVLRTVAALVADV
ncbi:TetR family transcriptional regulator [Rhodococcus sp. 27YEA15]|uniref:TetR family transcriptional regulator n=1 Tax=Rhodococcus sp. 27YEA15 TaxID=3156259 RepID=UPI003C7CCC21